MRAWLVGCVAIFVPTVVLAQLPEEFEWSAGGPSSLIPGSIDFSIEEPMKFRFTYEAHAIAYWEAYGDAEYGGHLSSGGAGVRISFGPTLLGLISVGGILESIPAEQWPPVIPPPIEAIIPPTNAQFVLSEPGNYGIDYLLRGSSFMNGPGGRGTIRAYNFSLTPVPEPSTCALALSGIAALVFAYRRRRALSEPTGSAESPLPSAAS